MAATTHFDFSQFKLRVNIRTSIENAYRAWATPLGQSSWFLGRCVFTSPEGLVRKGEDLLQAGDRYTLYFGCEDNQSFNETGKVLKANGKNLFSFTFTRDIPVTVSIYTEQDDTIVELIESNLPSDMEHLQKCYISHSRGWIFYLTNLKSVLEGGIDLRNKNEAITNVINH
jgi:uncharacterized protein YndB with AHSA1/START domain